MKKAVCVLRVSGTRAQEIMDSDAGTLRFLAWQTGVEIVSEYRSTSVGWLSNAEVDAILELMKEAGQNRIVIRGLDRLARDIDQLAAIFARLPGDVRVHLVDE